MDESQAITQLKQGDLAGLEFLVRQYQAQAVHAAYLTIGDLLQAEDVVQAAFLKIVRKIDQFDPRYCFRPWFLRIVINDAIKAARRQQKNVPLNDPTDAAISDWLLDKAPKPEEIIETGELNRRVWAALQQLPVKQRAVIVQRHFLEMSEAEMVEELQVPASTVKWWLHSARKSLKVLLAGENHE